MLASRKTARKAAECGNGLINSVDSSGLAVTVSRKDPRLDCSDSMPSAFRTRAGSSPKRVINSAARLSASSSRAASRSTGSTEDPPRARARTWARSSARCAPGVYASYIRSPVPSPVGLGWTATHWVHGAFAQTRPPGVNLLLLVRWRRSWAGSLEFPCPPSHHGFRFVRQSPTDGVVTCRLNPPDLPGGCGSAVPSPSLSHWRTPTVLARMIPFFALAMSAILLVLLPLGMVSAQTASKKPTSVLDFTMKDIDGKDVPLAKFQGKVLLIVNTASQCGYTPQYKGLQEIYQKYKDQGFEILAFPANEFGAQEPGTDDQIKQFCSSNYKVSFPLFSKIVVRGKGIHPLYEFLTSEATDPKHAGPIPWNFAKFLVNRKGEVVSRFQPGVKPESPELGSAIEEALAEK